MRSSTCVRCDAPLRLRSCGCWTSGIGNRWCPDYAQRHEPADGVQPERCQGAPREERA